MTIRKVIAGVDRGEHTPDVLRFAAVVSQAVGAELVLAHAYHYDPPFQSPDSRMSLRAQAMTRLSEVERALPYATRATLRAVEARSTVQGLHDLVVSERADLLVVGGGGIAERLLPHAACPVAVAPPGYAKEENPGLRVIGVAYDGSPEADDAVATAADLALAAGGTLKLIGVAEHHVAPMVGMATMYAYAPPEEQCRDALLQRLESVADALSPRLRTQIVLAGGEAAPELIERAGILSLLVMGSRGYGPLRRALLGSVSSPLLRATPCPVLVVPRGCAEAGATGATA